MDISRTTILYRRVIYLLILSWIGVGVRSFFLICSKTTNALTCEEISKSFINLGNVLDVMTFVLLGVASVMFVKQVKQWPYWKCLPFAVTGYIPLLSLILYFHYKRLFESVKSESLVPPTHSDSPKSPISKEVQTLDPVKRKQIVLISAAVGIGLFGVVAMAKQVPGVIIVIAMVVSAGIVFLVTRISFKDVK